jgi:hypothetical protein
MFFDTLETVTILYSCPMCIEVIDVKVMNIDQVLIGQSCLLGEDGLIL